MTIAGFAGVFHRDFLTARGSSCFLAKSRKRRRASSSGPTAVFGVGRIGRDLLGDGSHFADDGLAMSGLEQRPTQFSAPRWLDVLVHQQLAEQQPHPDVGEGPERKQAPRRGDEPVELRVLLLDLRHQAADRLVDDRNPELLRARHARA